MPRDVRTLRLHVRTTHIDSQQSEWNQHEDIPDDEIQNGFRVRSKWPNEGPAGGRRQNPRNDKVQGIIDECPWEFDRPATTGRRAGAVGSTVSSIINSITTGIISSAI